MTRSEYCIVNELDNLHDNIKRAGCDGEEHLADLKKLIGCLNLPDQDKFDDLVESLENVFNDVDSECSDFNDLIDGADTFAREHLESERESGFEDGVSSGYDDGYEQGKEDGDEESRQAGYDDAAEEFGGKVDDCVEHYEDFVRTVVDEFTEDWDSVDRIIKVKEIDERLADEKFDD